MNKKVNISAINHKIHFIYKDEREKNIAAIVIYNKDGKFFFDPEYKNEMSNLEVEALLLRGALVDRDGKYFRPSSFGVDNVSLSEGSGGGLATLPKVFISGTLPTSKEFSVKMKMEYKSQSMNFNCWLDIKCQGTSSMAYPKKNYTIKMFEDPDLQIKYKKNFKGWGEQNKFCLKANYVDTTHTRNLSGARIAKEMVDSRPDSDFKQYLLKTPCNGAVDGFPIRLYVNGEFHGIYTWNIPKDAWQFNMDEDNHNHIVLCAEMNSNTGIMSSCLFDRHWENGDGGDWSVESGEFSQDVVNSLNRCIDFVMDSSNEEFHDDIHSYFDLYSLIDYYCFSYLLAHVDGLAKNMLLVTYDGVHWGASLYDMDSCFGANTEGTAFKSPTILMPEDYVETNSLLWDRLEKCFAAEITERYLELRDSTLSVANIINNIENIHDLISDRDFDEEHSKWENLPSVNENTLKRVRTWVSERAEFVDQVMQGVSGEHISLSHKNVVLSLNTIYEPLDVTFDKGYGLARTYHYNGTDTLGTSIVGAEDEGVSDFIPIDFKEIKLEASEVRGIGACCYDENKNFLASFEFLRSIWYIGEGTRGAERLSNAIIGSFPENAKYVRLFFGNPELITELSVSDDSTYCSINAECHGDLDPALLVWSKEGSGCEFNHSGYDAYGEHATLGSWPKNNAIIKPLQAGTITVTCRMSDNPNIKAVCNIVIK